MKRVIPSTSEIPEDQLWLSERLEELMEPPFSTVLFNVAKIFIAIFVLDLFIFICVLLFVFLFMGGIYDALLNFLTQYGH